MKSFKNPISTEMSVLCALALTIPLQAATVVWSPSSPITDSADVVTTGTTVLAAHAKWNPTANETVNGVTFAATLNNSKSQSFTQSGVTLAFNTSTVINNTNPFIGSKQLTGPDADAYERTVSNAWEVNGGGSLTLSGLTNGCQYLVQFWVADFREYINDRKLTISGSPQIPFLGGNGSSTSSGRGNFITGTFTADSNTQVFTIAVAGADNSAMFNAFQLRESSAMSAPTFTPVAGTYPGTQTVSLTAEVGATIYYTTDGSTPNNTSLSGAPSSGTATVSLTAPGSMLLSAIATKAGMPDSPPATGSYIAVGGVGKGPDLADLRFTAALDAATIRQTSLSSASDNNLLLGNGDVNGLLYAGPSGLKLRLTKNDVWDARLDTSGDPPLPVVNIPAHTWTGAAGDPPSWRKSFPCPLACAVLDLTSATGPATNTLDLRRAVASVPGNNSAAPVSVRALADRNVFLIEGDTTVTLNPSSASFVPAAIRGTQDGVEYLVQTLPADLGYPTTGDWPGMSFAVAKAVQGTRTAVAIVTSMESSTPQAAAITLASEAITADANSLRQAHEMLWNQFWDACRVDLGDPYLRDVWYRNLYFMRCVSKAGVKPAGLFASLLNDAPDWHGDYHLNYNMQQTFWGWYGCNHAELSVPYESFINGLVPRAQWLANTTYGCGGAFFPHSVFLYEPSDPAACKSKNGRQMVFMPYTYTIGNSGWAVHNHWLHYKHHPDQTLLQNQVYPAIKQVALFYADFADKCATNATTGKITFGPTYSPEHWTFGKDDGTTDIAFARVTLKAAIEGATKLEVDSALVTRWQQTLAKLPDYPRTTGSSPVILDVAGVSPTTYNVPVPALPVYPAGEVHWFSPAAERQIFANTISSMSSNGNNDMIILAGARARLGMADAYSWMRAQFQARQRPNGQLMLSSRYPTYAPFTENFAATGVINELLLQSVNDILRIFPAWPADKEAAFENLRAQGGFLVSAEFKNGSTVASTIRSTVGGRLRFLNPWPATPIVRVNGSIAAPTNEGGGIFHLDTAANDQIILAPTSFISWQSFHFGSPSNPNANSAEDPDADGHENSLEYALGLDPLVANGTPPGTFTAGRLTYTKSADAIAGGDVTYVIETSDNLGTWIAQVTQAPPNNSPTISYTLPTGLPREFARLKVTMP